MNNKPNIIFFFSDQQRADTISNAVTPNLCDLQREGTSFDFTYTCQPVCGPARACLQSGIYATQNGCLVNGIPLDKSCTEKTLAECFNDAGYETGYIGKWHLASHDMEYRSKGVPESLRAGYKYWLASDLLEFSSNGFGGTLWDNDCNPVEFKGIRSDKLTDYAIDYIKSVKNSNFFLFLSQLEPHHQNTSGNFECPSGGDKEFLDYPIPDDLKGLEGDYERNIPGYLGCCKRLDYNVKRIIDSLKEMGIYDNTIFIYTSDHGCHFKTRNSEYKRSCHSASTHVPLIIEGKGIPKNVKSQKLVSLIDLPPTLLTLAGIDVPKNYMGHDIFSNYERENVFIQISESQNGRCITTKKYIYSVRQIEGSDNVYVEDFLYDKTIDKAEKNNLLNDSNYLEIKNNLKNMLVSEMLKVGEKEPKIILNNSPNNI